MSGKGQLLEVLLLRGGHVLPRLSGEKSLLCLSLEYELGVKVRVLRDCGLRLLELEHCEKVLLRCWGRGGLSRGKNSIEEGLLVLLWWYIGLARL